MEIIKVITHSQGGSNYINNGINYLFDGRCVVCHGYGINPYDANTATMQFKQNAKFWNHHNKNPFLHFMISFSQETAPTADITGQPVTLVVKPECGEEWKCPLIFTPQNNDEE